MPVVPLSHPANRAENGFDEAPRPKRTDSTPWLQCAAAGTLAASGALLVTGKRRAGLVTAAIGTVLVMIDQKEVVSAWWSALPDYLADIQELLGRAQIAVEDLSAEAEKLRRVFDR
jgi:hypothetical protein